MKGVALFLTEMSDWGEREKFDFCAGIVPDKAAREKSLAITKIGFLGRHHG